MINRDVEFWDSVARHPEVAPNIFCGMDILSLSPLIDDERNKPFASEHGGVIFVSVDHLGMVWEMHTLYTPEGWGREIATNARIFASEIFKAASMLITHEQEENWRTSPPKSHGWRPAGEYKDVGLPKRLKLWTLTREAWVASPVGRKMQCQ